MNVQEKTGVDEVYPEGDLTIFEAAEFHEALKTRMEGKGAVDLDLSKVGRIDSSGIQIILAGKKSGNLTIRGVTASMREKFENIGCAAYLEP